MRDHANNWVTGAGVVATSLFCTAAVAETGATRPDFPLIERGRYLTVAADCAACHDDPYAGRPFAGGRPIETPFGNVAAPNITPDRETGIGAWTNDQFEAVLRHGRMPNGQHLYPAMPFPYYTKMPAEDVKAIRAYLSTVTPVHNPVVANQLPFPFSIRTSMVFWNALYFKDGEFQQVPSQSAQWNRGAYLVQGPGHCGACHTPKTLAGGDKSSMFLQGGVIQGWYAPNLTNDKSRGLAEWSNQDVVEYLESGHNRLAAASGPMAEEVTDSSSHMNRADLEAIAAYLKDQGGQSGSETAIAANDPDMVAGAAIYGDLCSACHRHDGAGVPYLIPNLAGTASVAATEPTSAIRVVMEGAQSVATDKEPTGPIMPAYAWQLSDVQIAAVVTYIRNSWAHAAGRVHQDEVSAARHRLETASGADR